MFFLQKLSRGHPAQEYLHNLKSHHDQGRLGKIWLIFTQSYYFFEQSLVMSILGKLLYVTDSVISFKLVDFLLIFLAPGYFESSSNASLKALLWFWVEFVF